MDADVKDADLTENKKIRLYIMGLIYKNSFKAVKVPSSNELASRFGVARRTARVALEGLVQEGWLSGKRGSGTFTNPAKGFTFMPGDKIPLIGVVYGRGDNFYYDLNAAMAFTCAGQSLAKCGFNVRFLTQLGHSDEAILAELENSALDGLLWASLEKLDQSLLDKALKLNFKIVTLGVKTQSASSVHFSYGNAISSLAETFIAEGRANLLAICDKASSAPQIAMLKDEYRKQGLSLKTKIMQHVLGKSGEQLRAALDAGEKPDILATGWGKEPQEAMDILREYGIDFKSRCRLLALRDICDADTASRFSGIVLRYPYQAAADAAAKIMRGSLDGSRPQAQRTIDIRAQKYESGMEA